jgi:hypothetical protein
MSKRKSYSCGAPSRVSLVWTRRDSTSAPSRKNVSILLSHVVVEDWHDSYTTHLSCRYFYSAFQVFVRHFQKDDSSPCFDNAARSPPRMKSVGFSEQTTYLFSAFQALRPFPARRVDSSPYAENADTPSSKKRVGFNDESTRTVDVVTDDDDDDDNSLVSSYDSTSSSSSSSSSYLSLMDLISDVTWGSASFSWSVGSKKSIVSLLKSRWGPTNCPTTPTTTTTASSTTEHSSVKDLTASDTSDQVKPPRQPCRRVSTCHQILVQEKAVDKQTQPTCLCAALREPSLAPSIMNEDSDMHRSRSNSTDIARGVNATTTSLFDVNQAKQRVYDLCFI